MIQMIFGSPVVLIKNNNVDALLPTKIYEEIFDYLMRAENRFIDHPDTRGGQICTTDLNASFDQDTIVGITALINHLKNTALDYLEIFDTKATGLEFSYYWINLTFRGCEIRNHIDKNSDHSKRLVVTFYPRAPKNGAELVFLHSGLGGEWVSDCDQKDLIKIAIDQGDIAILDTYTLHAVSPHMVDEPRMCIAVEFIII